MALWGISTSDESKPKYLNQEDKNNCIAKPEGWVLKKTVGSRNLEEVLVAVGSNTDLGTTLGRQQSVQSTLMQQHMHRVTQVKLLLSTTRM